MKRLGLSNSLVAEKLQVPIRTIERDLAWWREKNVSLCKYFFAPELIGETLSVYAEIEGIALYKAEQHKNNTDTSELSRLLAVALKARSELIDFLFRVGTLQDNWQESFGPKDYDVSKMSPAELKKAEEEIETKIKEVEAQLLRIDSPNLFKQKCLDT